MDPDTLVRLAQWFERRIDDSLGIDLPAARLYGLIVNDPERLDADESAGRASYLGEDVDIYRLLAGPFAAIARSFEAAAVVTSGWAAPDTTHPGPGGGVRPSEHPDRRRMRVVALVGDAGVRSVTRFADAPTSPVVMSERGMGGVIDALEALWFGDPFAALSRVSHPSTSRACRRRT